MNWICGLYLYLIAPSLIVAVAVCIRQRRLELAAGRFLVVSCLDYLMLPLWLVGAPVVSLFTRAQDDMDENTKPWGGWFGTYDNPPKGDRKHQRDGLFPGALTGWRGYIMRVLWLWRNPGYNWQKRAGIEYPIDGLIEMDLAGNADITDKYQVPGWYFATLVRDDRLIAFEFYAVWPWAFGKCVRLRVGYKIMTDKFERYGFAPLVNTFNPVKSYGN